MKRENILSVKAFLWFLIYLFDMIDKYIQFFFLKKKSKLEGIGPEMLEEGIL